MSEKISPYAEIRDALMTGDLVIFQGLGWDSDVIMIVEMSRWTHVGMVVREEGVAYPLLWESFPFTFVDDVILHRRKSGARLVSLDERLAVGTEKKLFSRVAVRHLHVQRTPEIMAALHDFIAGRFHYLPYPGAWKILFDYLRGKIFREKKKRADEVQCAELVAETYKRMGLLSGDTPSNSFVPKDFSSDGSLALQGGAELEEERFLILDKEFAAG
ncbi:MAG TPA: hypothetical protein VF799_00720 [Geobacteraceae bacterium]